MKCPWAEDLADAKRVAVQLGIDFKVFDFETEYREKVVQYMIDEDAKNTNQNAELTAKIITDNKFKKIILTTSGYHQRRAYLEFSRALYGTGVEIINAPAQNDPQWTNFWWLSLRGWQLTLSELGGIIIFFVEQGANNG